MAAAQGAGRHPRRGRALTPPELRALLADSLVLWGCEGRVSITGGGVTVALPALTLHVTPAAAGEAPIRWWVEKPGQKRPCTSVLGLLRTLRNAAGGGEMLRLQVVPS